MEFPFQKSFFCRCCMRFQKLFIADATSPVEREVRRRLTWRLLMIALVPIPFAFLLGFLLCHYVESNRGPTYHYLKMVESMDEETKGIFFDRMMWIVEHEEAERNSACRKPTTAPAAHHR